MAYKHSGVDVSALRLWRGPQALDPLKRIRIVAGILGVALIGYGIVRIFANLSNASLMGLGRWLAGAVIVHDGIFVPMVSVLGFVLTKVFRPRARRYIQATLIVEGTLTLIDLTEIYLQGTKDPGKAWLSQDYERNLHILWMIVATAGVLGYVASIIYARVKARRQEG